MPRVLFVSYAYPPVGGVGVQRVLKWTKFLPEFGWDCSVLTVANPSVPTLDESLAEQIPASTTVVRARTLEPGYAAKQTAAATDASPLAKLKGAIKRPLVATAKKLLQPDAQILWHRDAKRVGQALLEETPHDVIVATAPPFSALLLGRWLANASGLPLAVDYRDEWDLSNRHWENKRPGRLAHAVQARMQNAALKAATHVLSTSPGTARELARRSRQAGVERPSTFIYNGYDPDDFPPLPDAPREDFGHGTERFRLTFAGTLWTLNSIAPFAAGIEQLDRAAADRLELVLVGRRLDDEEAHLDRIAAAGVAVSRVGFVPHARAVELMRRSDALLQQTIASEGTERVISAKTFEYLASGRPILFVGSDGDQADLVRRMPHSYVANANDPQSIAEAVAALVAAGRVDSLDPPPELHRREGARQLSELLSSLVADATPSAAGLAAGSSR